MLGVLYGSGTTLGFKRRTKVELNAIFPVLCGSSTTSETGLRVDICTTYDFACNNYQLFKT